MKSSASPVPSEVGDLAFAAGRALVDATLAGGSGTNDKERTVRIKMRPHENRHKQIFQNTLLVPTILHISSSQSESESESKSE